MIQCLLHDIHLQRLSLEQMHSQYQLDCRERDFYLNKLHQINTLVCSFDVVSSPSQAIPPIVNVLSEETSIFKPFNLSLASDD